MDPASLIVAALVSGMLAGVRLAAQHALHEGYLDLRAAIVQRYGAKGGAPLEEAIEALEAEPAAPERQTALALQLQRVGADTGPGAPSARQQADGPGRGPEQRWSTPSSRPITTPGCERSPRYGSPYRQGHGHPRAKPLTTPTCSDQQWEVKEVSRRSATKSSGCAGHARDHRADRSPDRGQTTIETPSGQSGSMPMDYSERERAPAGGGRQACHLLPALRITVEYFSELNEGVLQKIDREQSPDREANMMLGTRS